MGAAIGFTRVHPWCWWNAGRIHPGSGIRRAFTQLTENRVRRMACAITGSNTGTCAAEKPRRAREREQSEVEARVDIRPVPGKAQIILWVARPMRAGACDRTAVVGAECARRGGGVAGAVLGRDRLRPERQPDEAPQLLGGQFRSGNPLRVALEVCREEQSRAQRLVLG